MNGLDADNLMQGIQHCVLCLNTHDAGLGRKGVIAAVP